MSTNNVRYQRGRLAITVRGLASHIESASIVMIDECRMADQVNYPDETFFLLYMEEVFWLLAPSVDGAIEAISALRSDFPSLKYRQAIVESLPRKLRAPGLLGLKLWPIPALRSFHRRELSSLSLRTLAAE